MYTGQPQIIKDMYGKDPTKVIDVIQLKPNQSPVSFFDPDFDLHQNLQYIDADYYLNLREGDCVYIPAFYFVQYKGLPNVAPEVDGMWSSAIALTLKYKSNSQLLNAFFEAVELELVT